MHQITGEFRISARSKRQTAMEGASHKWIDLPLPSGSAKMVFVVRHLCPCFVQNSPKKCYKGLKAAHLRGTEVGRKWDFSISGTTSSKSRFLCLDGIAFPLKKQLLISAPWYP